MQKIKKTLDKGTHVLSIPSGNKISLEELFPKEISGSTIEELDSNGSWCHKEVILYKNNAFLISDNYKLLHPLQTIRLVLKRSIDIEWDVGFASHSGLQESSLVYEEGFDLDEALYLAQLSELVYFNETIIKETLANSYDFETFNYYSKQSHKKLLQKGWVKLLISFFKSKTTLINLQFMHLSKIDKKTGKNLIVIVFKGSKEPQDWLTNFNLRNEKFEGHGNVHKGFNESLKLFFELIKNKDLTDMSSYTTVIEDIENINENSQIILTGHSLGGALATLAGCYLYEKGIKKENLEVYTFGSPPVGTKEFTKYYHDKINLYRLVNENDVVPKLDKLLNLSHLGTKIVLPSNNGEIHSCKDYTDNIIDKIGLT